MAGNTVNSEIQRLKQNVSDAYTAIEQNMGKEVAEPHTSDYINENIAEIGKNIQVIIIDETITMDINLDEYEIVDITPSRPDGGTSGGAEN